MKKIATTLMLMLVAVAASAQQVYWVFLTDKAGTSFDPYAYFDAKAIERYNQCGANLYDTTNYPLSEAYVQAVTALATDVVGSSRWLNAMGVEATTEQAQAIADLPCVLRVQPIVANMQLSSAEAGISDHATVEGPLEAQLVRMQGERFRAKGIDGKGVRIAVFDGGFPRVNTHDAFRHLRDNHQILKTWNFPNRRENVYGWNSHGTMTLSCIAGRIEGRDLGLATGAEFLLARTEVEAEPFKEEVWWMQAVEWADQNGANIISSSLGYGKERHYTRDMDGTSYVARAANMAARKGMLVVNSAGNEADDKQWKTIITPSDADSVLCIGGIENSLTEYNHISFSSYGPSADGRLKPNVCAFGYARTANITSDQATHYVHGTSFSCPLVAGFAACAWQASPGTTAMQLFHEIERSADLYPYYDYAFGYGVPQASHFVGSKDAVQPTFHFEETDTTILIVPNTTLTSTDIFYNTSRDNGTLVSYGKAQIIFADAQHPLYVYKTALHESFLERIGRLNVSIGGYCATFTPSQADISRTSSEYRPLMLLATEGAVCDADWPRNKRSLNTSNWGSNARWSIGGDIMLGLPIATASAEMPCNIWSPAVRASVQITRAFSKSYRLGLGIEVGNARYNYKGAAYNGLENVLDIPSTALAIERESRRSADVTEVGLEFFQRIRIVPIGLTGAGLHWDLGLYASLGCYSYTLSGQMPQTAAASRLDVQYRSPEALAKYGFNYGISTRLAYDWWGIYARYRLRSIGTTPSATEALMPRLEVGVDIHL